MASVEKTLTSLLCFYPSLFSCKMDAFDQLFLVIGNGYEWYKGEVSSRFNQDENNIDVEADIPLEVMKEEALKKLIKQNQNGPYSKYTVGKWKYQVEHIEDLIAASMHSESTGKSFYGIHEGYSLITKLPDNITKDWFKAVKDFVYMYNYHLRCLLNAAPYRFINVEAVQKEIDKLELINKRIDELEAKFKGITYEEYLKLKQENDKQMMELIRDAVK